MTFPAVVIVDSGGANLASLQFALQRLGVDSCVSSDAAQIQRATHVVLPGVGSAGQAMQRLAARALDTLLPQLTQPVLGICLGMQLLFAHSEEGNTRGLSVIPGNVRRILPAEDRPVPHMGWNRVRLLRADPLFDGIDDGAHMYFVHSFAASAAANEATGPAAIASTDYGAPLCAAARRDNFCGTQFHPERSGVAGARLLANFVKL